MGRVFINGFKKRWNDPKGLLQVLTGPRQVGKTTAITSLIDEKNTIYASADLPSPPTIDFIVTHWEKARGFPTPDRALVLDEVQKIPRWSEVVKGLWEEDRRNRFPLKVCLLGSSALLIEKGLSESLTGRFETSYFPHWIFPECRETFGSSLAAYAVIGGYPKAYDFREDPERLEGYLQSSIIEPALGRDILALHSVDKPALLRQLFWYVSRLPSQIVSYEKILAHLQGRGNSATLVHYSELLAAAFLVVPLSNFSFRPHRTKRSLPKWVIPNPALIDSSIRKQGLAGFLFENLVGAHLLNIFFGSKRYSLHYWREEEREIDFILADKNEPTLAIEVKSGRLKKIPAPTIDNFKKRGFLCPVLVVSQENIETFLRTVTIEEILAVPPKFP